MYELKVYYSMIQGKLRIVGNLLKSHVSYQMCNSYKDLIPFWYKENCRGKIKDIEHQNVHLLTEDKIVSM
jgi:hypothetical protein